MLRGGVVNLLLLPLKPGVRGGSGGTHQKKPFPFPSLSLFLILVAVVTVTPTLTHAQSTVNLGKFVYNHHGLAGEVTLLNDRQYRIKGFSYDGKGPAVFHTGMRRGTVGVYSSAAYTFANEHNSCARLDKPYSNVNVVITLPRNLSLSRDIETLSVYCYKFCHNFGHVKIPRGLKLPPAPGNLKGGVLCKPNYPTCSRDRTRDNAVCVDDRGAEGTCPVKTRQQQQAKSSSSTGRSSSSSSNRFQQQQGRNTRQRQTNNNGGSGGGRPNPRVIGRFRSHANGVVGQVTILNDRQFRVRGFSYTGARSKSTHFILMEKGVAGVFSVKGFAVPDEKGACNGLRSYRNEDIVVTIPQEISLSRDVSAIGVYDYENCSNFAHVKLPDRLNVPKATASSIRSIKRNVCLPFYRPCSRRDTRNPGVCKGRRGTELTC